LRVSRRAIALRAKMVRRSCPSSKKAVIVVVISATVLHVLVAIQARHDLNGSGARLLRFATCRCWFFGPGVRNGANQEASQAAGPPRAFSPAFWGSLRQRKWRSIPRRPQLFSEKIESARSFSTPGGPFLRSLPPPAPAISCEGPLCKKKRGGHAAFFCHNCLVASVQLCSVKKVACQRAARMTPGRQPFGDRRTIADH